MNNRALEEFLAELGPYQAYWPALAFLAAIVVLWIIFRAIRHEELPSLILKEFYASRTADRGLHVVISGRPRGLWAFFLWLFGLGTKIRFEVSKDSVGLQISNWHFKTRDSVPINNVASTTYGYATQTAYLVLAILAMLTAIAGTVVTMIAFNDRALRHDGLAGALCCASIAASFLFVLAILFYRSSARLDVAIETNGGRSIGVRFKRGMFGSPAVDLRDASEIVEIINSLIR